MFWYQVLARPHATVKFTPHMKFYVVESTARENTIVDFESFNGKAGVVDFTDGPGLNHQVAYVTLEQGGTFSVSYHEGSGLGWQSFRA